MKYTALLALAAVLFYVALSPANADAKLSIVKGGERPRWVTLENYERTSPITIPINGYGEWAYCEAYSKPLMASAFVRCFTQSGPTGASVGGYCDLDTEKAWKERSEWITKTEFHLDAGQSAAGWLTVTLDCR